MDEIYKIEEPGSACPVSASPLKRESAAWFLFVRYCLTFCYSVNTLSIKEFTNTSSCDSFDRF